MLINYVIMFGVFLSNL